MFISLLFKYNFSNTVTPSFNAILFGEGKLELILGLKVHS
jgi:hypothetical protein